MYIAIDGLDGVGKSTTIKEMNRILTEKGFNVIQVAEPGDTPNYETDSVRDEIRRILKTKKMDKRTQAFLFFADRNELLSSPKIQDNLDNDSIILSDRCFATTYAYQQDNRHNDMEFHGLLRYMVNVYPDIIVLIDASAKTINKRMKERNLGTDVLEDVTEEEIAKRREGYINFEKFIGLSYISRCSKEFNPYILKYTVIDTLSPEEVAMDILKKIAVNVDSALADYRYDVERFYRRSEAKLKLFATEEAAKKYLEEFDFVSAPIKKTTNRSKTKK